MHTLFNTRPNYRICLGVNADFAFAKTKADARVGTSDPINQSYHKYISINKTSVIEETYKVGWNEVIEKVKHTITNITFKTKALFIYNKKEIEQVLEKLYDDLGNKFDKLKDRHKSADALKKIHYFSFVV